MSIEALKAGIQDAPIQKSDRLLRDAEVRSRTSVGKTRRGELMRSGEFPLPIKICGGRTNYWLQSDIDLWIERQVVAHRAEEDERRAEIARVANEGLNGWLNQAVTRAKRMEAGNE